MTPISRLTDQHACPLPLHGLTPIVSASPNVFVNGLPVARVGDKSGCGAVIVSGIPNILINGRPIAHIGSLSSHGGTIITGSINTMGGGPVTSKLVIDFSKLGAISDDGSINEELLTELLTDPHLKQRAQAAGALLKNNDAPSVVASFAFSFRVTDSETGKPLANRAYTVVVDGNKATGLTDAQGMVNVAATKADSIIKLHIEFNSPARTLTELSEAPLADDQFTTMAKAYPLRPGESRPPVAVTVNDRAATREAIIRKVRALGHQFVERSEWRAKPPKNPLERDWDYSMIALHHAGRSYSCGRSAEQMLDIQRGHQSDVFDDIGYHFGIDCQGVIYEGRDIRFKGSSVYGYNTGVIGIVLLNNLSTPEEGEDWVASIRKRLHSAGIDSTHEISKRQVDATVNLTTALKNVLAIKHFGGHREFPNQKAEGKICPGNIGMELIFNIRKLTQLMAPPIK
ncbi:PAAR domain-containing protein [Pseudomonas cichorii]|nr:PAAR domain-containing protein [Pseudomonas cichorii]MBX8544846.1 PAAR domain-containing protein [Pseudomonas cichorii]MBX8580272.1 PAAR domain-containing protein [Pseudomonas cichorii]MBX8590930.1 PAAR domain-containing protein [Pseudomonas cichorii]MBX8597908.1 PAAR domain-containing protein [Pseudomonas cichorii]